MLVSELPNTTFVRTGATEVRNCSIGARRGAVSDLDDVLDD